jgi:hypothetical protein
MMISTSSPLPELLVRLAAIDRDLAALQRLYDLICNPPKPPRRRRRPTPRRHERGVMPALIDVREFPGIAPLWAFMEDVEGDTALPKPKKSKKRDVVEAVDAQPSKSLPMLPAPLPAPKRRVSSLERTRREGLGYDEVDAGKRGKQPNWRASTVKGAPVINHALAELEAVDGERVALA